MSNLSDRELCAGISRKALETIRTNGQKPRGEPGSLEEHLAASAKYQIPSPVKFSIVDTWDRSLDLLNRDGWNFAIRETQHLRAVCSLTITLNRVELEMLGRRIAQALTEKAE